MNAYSSGSDSYIANATIINNAKLQMATSAHTLNFEQTKGQMETNRPCEWS